MPLRYDLCEWSRCGLLLGFCLALCSADAQIPQEYISPLPVPAVRIVVPVNDNQLTMLRGNRHPLANAENDRGAVTSDQPLRRMLMLLRRSAQQEYALAALLMAQQDPNSPLFHKWLTPAQFGASFGVADQDVQTITDWLSSHGFHDIAVSNGHTVIEFSGNAGQVRSAFHTAIHRYQALGAMHFANQADPSIPTVLAPVVAGLVSLNDFGHHSMAVRGPSLQFTKGQARPQVIPESNPEFTVPEPGNYPSFFGVSPYDFASIYDLAPLWKAGLDGTGQTIAIVGETNININDPEQFRAFFGLPVNNPIITVAGIDPGVQPDETEADLDVEWSGAIAKGARVELVTSARTETTEGVDLAALYIVDNNLAPVMSESYGDCELFLGTQGNAFEASMWQQAAAEGITVLVSSGDQGAAGCDTTGYAAYPMAVNGLASTPYNIAVGGTDFNQYNSWTTYWSANDDPTTKQSVLGYIPEIPWNDSCGSSLLDGLFGFDPANACSRSFSYNTIAGSGGPSSCISSDGTNAGTCTAGWPKPMWQTGAGVPSDGVRDVPDLSLFASNGVYNSAYVVCQVDKTGGSGCDPTASTQSFLAVGGTSGSTPAMAGVMAIINQKYGRQGNANPTLYRLAASTAGASIFHDITTDGNRVACTAQNSDCEISATAPIQLGRTKGHDSTAGFDMVTGLGSIDIANLVNNWTAVSFNPTTTTLALNGGSATVTAVHGTSISASASVSASAGNPSGDVTLVGTQANSSVFLGTLVGGTVTENVISLPGGTYSVAARYGGDAQFAPSESAPVSVNISPEPSTTKLSIRNYDTASKTFVPATTVVYGSLLLVGSDISGQSGHGTPTGSITLNDTGNSIGQFALNSQASTMYFPNNLILGGVHSLEASYSGDPSFNPSVGTSNITVSQAQMTCGVGSNTTVLRPGWTLRLYAGTGLYEKTVTPPLGNMVPPTGTLTVYSGSTAVVGPATGTAQGGGGGAGGAFTLPAMSLPPTTLQISQLESATAPLTVVYSGDSNYTSCTSPPLQLTYETGPIASTMFDTLTPQGNILVGTPINVNAQVGPATAPPTYEPAYPAPTGTVQLSVDGVNIGSPLSLTSGFGVFPPVGFGNYGAAGFTIPTASLSPGMHSAAVSYSGDSNYFSSNSYNINFLLVVPDFSISAYPVGLSVTNGQATSASTIQINALNGFTGAVALSCSGLPSGAACIFSPPSVTTSGNTTLTISTTQAQNVRVPVLARTHPNRPLWLFGAESVSSAFVVLLFVRKRWRKTLGLCVTAAIGFTLGVTSCGGGGGGGGGGGTQTQPTSTITSLTASSATPAKGADDTFTANVAGGLSSQPAGSIQFSVDGLASGSPVTLSNATGQFVTSFSTAGSHSVSAAYSGDGTHLSSTSSAFKVNVPYTSGSMPGIYPVTISATSGTLTHTATLTLVVQ